MEEREPYSQVETGQMVSNPGKCKHSYKEEKKNENGMTVYVCIRCGHGLMIGKDDSIENYK